MKINEVSKLWGYTPETIRKWCQSGKIAGATQEKKGSPWYIPQNAKCPKRPKKQSYFFIERNNEIKQLACEMCGSLNLIKQDSIFVCQSCGYKYSIENTKDLIIEKIIDINGNTNKVNNTKELNSLLASARHAKDNENDDFTQAQKYYKKIILEYPNNWEAVFYNAYYQCMNCKSEEIQQVAISFTKSLDTVFELVNKNIAGKKNKILIVDEICEHCLKITNLLIQKEKEHFNKYMPKIGSDIYYQHLSKMKNICFSCTCIMYHLGDCIHTVFSNITKLYEYATSAWDFGIVFQDHINNFDEKYNIIYQKYRSKSKMLKQNIK